MSKRKRPPRSARGRVQAPRPESGRPTAGAKKTAPPPEHGAGASGGLSWFFGTHAVLAALANPGRRYHRLLVTQAAAQQHAAQLTAVAAKGTGPEVVDRSEIDAVVGPDAVHQGLAVLVSPRPDVAIEDIAAIQGPATVVVLDQASDPRNIGAVMRSAWGFGAAAVILQDRNSPAETGVMAKAASGAAEHVALVRVTNIARAMWTLKDAGFWCVGLDAGGTMEIGDVDISDRSVLVLGAEGAGLRRLTMETCDLVAFIDIAPGADSLNLSNAAAVALYALNRKKKKD